MTTQAKRTPGLWAIQRSGGDYWLCDENGNEVSPIDVCVRYDAQAARIASLEQRNGELERQVLALSARLAK